MVLYEKLKLVFPCVSLEIIATLHSMLTQIQERLRIAQVPIVPTSIAVQTHHQLPRTQYQLATGKETISVQKRNYRKQHYTKGTP